ncbi:hypothetical protein ACFYRJ_36350 [Streptomyces sp. NPDC005531]|uniref:hypothetical protein n=1 Tax=Streptomyces sp. NPDC005531 TaxID=3364722 RepID=UPI00369FFAE7
MSTRAAAWWPLLVAIERVVDATTAIHVEVAHGAEAPPAGQTRSIAQQLRELGGAVRTRPGPGAVSAAAETADHRVLAALRQEVAGAGAVLAPWGDAGPDPNP